MQPQPLIFNHSVLPQLCALSSKVPPCLHPFFVVTVTVNGLCCSCLSKHFTDDRKECVKNAACNKKDTIAIFFITNNNLHVASLAFLSVTFKIFLLYMP